MLGSRFLVRARRVQSERTQGKQSSSGHNVKNISDTMMTLSTYWCLVGNRGI